MEFAHFPLFFHGTIGLRSEVEDLTRRLQEEQRARSNAERILKDVERECQHPFIMPQLLQAFLQVANATNLLEDAKI
jgi:hypothetical protein